MAQQSSTEGRVMCDKSIASWGNEIGTKVLLGREYADQSLRFFNEPEIADPRLKVLLGGLVLRIYILLPIKMLKYQIVNKYSYNELGEDSS